MKCASKARVLASAVLLAAGAAFAEGPPYQPAPATGYDSTYRRHFGFYIRPDLGFGYQTSSESGFTISGGAALIGLAIGGALSENSILAGHIFGSGVSNPNVSGGGASGTANDTTLTMSGIGPQYTYYFMPSNVYLSTTLALTRMRSSTRNGDFDSNYGIGTRIALGKEWWVGDHWGLGVVGHVSFSTNQDPVAGGGTNTLTTWAFGAAFSATYN
ncbi:MAG TPA: hypothetical protein VF994_13660 [Myxococcales bacterium]